MSITMCKEYFWNFFYWMQPLFPHPKSIIFICKAIIVYLLQFIYTPVFRMHLDVLRRVIEENGLLVTEPTEMKSCLVKCVFAVYKFAVETPFSQSLRSPVSNLATVKLSSHNSRRYTLIVSAGNRNNQVLLQWTELIAIWSSHGTWINLNTDFS